MRSSRLAIVVAVAAVASVGLVAGVAGPVRVGEPVIEFDLFSNVVPCEDADDATSEQSTGGPRGLFDDCDDEEDDPLAEWWDANGPPMVFSVGSALASALVLLAGAALLVWLLRRLVEVLSRLRPPPMPRRRPADEVTVEVVRSLHEAADLAAHEAESAPPGRAGDAVVACWVLLEDAAARAGTPRGVANTPTEFTADLLTEHQPDQDAVATLLRLYHRARFGSQPMPDEAAREAGDALRRIAAGLAMATDRTGGAE